MKTHCQRRNSEGHHEASGGEPAQAESEPYAELSALLKTLVIRSAIQQIQSLSVVEVST